MNNKLRVICLTGFFIALYGYGTYAMGNKNESSIENNNTEQTIEIQAVQENNKQKEESQQPIKKSKIRRIRTDEIDLNTIASDRIFRLPKKEGKKEINGRQIKYQTNTKIKVSKDKQKFIRFENISYAAEGLKESEISLYDDNNTELFKKDYKKEINYVYMHGSNFVSLEVGGAYSEPEIEIYNSNGSLIYNDNNSGAIKEFPSEKSIIYFKTINNNQYTVIKFNIETKQSLELLETNYPNYSVIFSGNGFYCISTNDIFFSYDSDDKLLWKKDIDIKKGVGVSNHLSNSGEYFLFTQGSRFVLIDNNNGSIIWEKDINITKNGINYTTLGGVFTENNYLKAILYNPNNMDEFRKFKLEAILDLDSNMIEFKKIKK